LGLLTVSGLESKVGWTPALKERTNELSIDFHSGLMMNSSHLLHSDRHVTDLVNIEHVDNRQQDTRSCLVHPIDRFDSEGWFSCNQVIF